MSRKHDRTGRSKKEARFLTLDHFMLNSQAWKSLRAVERAVYVELAKEYNGYNNGRIGFSVRGGEEMGISPATTVRALHRLMEIGFIALETKGAFSRKNRHASEWRLTVKNSDLTGELATKEFMRWQPHGAPDEIGSEPQNSKHGARGETHSTSGETVGARSETAKGRKGPDGVSGETNMGVSTQSLGASGETHIIYHTQRSAAASEKSSSRGPKRSSESSKTPSRQQLPPNGSRSASRKPKKGPKRVQKT